MGDQDLICFCMSVTRGEIEEAVRAGSDTIGKLKRSVGCCTGCGTCEGRVRAVLEATQIAMKAGSDTPPGSPNSSDDKSGAA